MTSSNFQNQPNSICFQTKKRKQTNKNPNPPKNLPVYSQPASSKRAFQATRASPFFSGNFPKTKRPLRCALVSFLNLIDSSKPLASMGIDKILMGCSTGQRWINGAFRSGGWSINRCIIFGLSGFCVWLFGGFMAFWFYGAWWDIQMEDNRMSFFNNGLRKSSGWSAKSEVEMRSRLELFHNLGWIESMKSPARKL